MWSKLTALILLTFLIPLNLSGDDPPRLDAEGLPSKEFTYLLMETNPELIWQMVRKLYTIEQTLPTLSIPPIVVIEEKSGTLTIGYQGTPEAALSLGRIPYIINYKIKLETTPLAGYKVPVKVPVYVYISGSILLVLSGFLMGISIH